jgi:scyllo-inositol 2-dehydrogenase (NADP+)
MASRVFHAPLIHANPNLRLSHIVQRHGDEAQKAYPQARVLRDVDALLADPTVTLVVVATPNTSHHDIATRSLTAGKHVVVDKPFTITSADADDLIAVARKDGRILSVFQSRRFDGDFRTVKQILGQKILGRLAEFESHYDRFRPSLNPKAWREQALPGSGVLYDLGSHLIDQALVLFGQPTGIYAEVRHQRGGPADDSFQVHLEYPQVKVLLKAGNLVCETGPRFVLHGTEGSYLKYGMDPQEEALKSGASPDQPNWGREAEQAWGTHTRCNGQPTRTKYPTLPGCYPEFYNNIARTIHGQGELTVKPEQSGQVIRLIELAQQSSQEKRMLPFS